MVVLSVAATATEDCILGTCVIQLPLRRAAAVAKQAATLQTLSRGRVVLGVGVGSHAGEYEQAGDRLPRPRTAPRCRDHRAPPLVGDRWPSDEEAARYRQLPASAPVPVWVGGSSEAALRRAAALADGWMPLFVSPSDYRQAVDRLAKEVERAGRAADEVIPSMVLFVSIDDDVTVGLRRGTEWMSSLYGIPAKAFERHLVSGTAAEVADVVATYRAAGAAARGGVRHRRSAVANSSSDWWPPRR